MPTKSWDEYLAERTATRAPGEQAAFDIASVHFSAVATRLPDPRPLWRRVLRAWWR